jgi:hypothetical protein
MPEKEHSAAIKNSRVFPETSLLIELLRLLIFPESLLLIISGKVLGSLPDTTTVSSNLRSKICTANPKSFVDWYG